MAKGKAANVGPATKKLVAKKPIHLKVEIDLDEMTIGDIELMTNYADRKEGESVSPAVVRGVIEFLDRVVVGGARHRKQSEFMPLMDAVIAKINKTRNPETEAGN